MILKGVSKEERLERIKAEANTGLAWSIGPCRVETLKGLRK